MPQIKVVPRPANPDSLTLARFERSVYSQHGEDGIIARIFDIIGAKTRWCVEFGAWDGVHLSNVCALIRHQNWSAVMIEANDVKFAELKKNYTNIPNVYPICRYIDLVGPHTLDAVLGTTPIPEQFDLLSIDVDGIDWHIWSSLTRYRPRVVVIEFNRTIPAEVHFVQDADPRCNQGASLRALVTLGTTKGYELVYVNQTNAFFVERALFSLFGIKDNSLDAMFSCTDATYLLQGYDGSVHLAGCRKLLWKNVTFDERNIKILPHEQQVYPDRALAARFGKPAPGPNLALHKPASQSSLSSWSKPGEAAGAVSGGRTGRHAFCTAAEASPWWQVDLEQIVRVGEVRIYNRLGAGLERARTLSILLSIDGSTWTEAYRHDGSPIGVDAEPLIVTLPGRTARFLRIALNEATYLHLDEVEVYAA